MFRVIRHLGISTHCRNLFLEMQWYHIKKQPARRGNTGVGCKINYKDIVVYNSLQ